MPSNLNPDKKDAAHERAEQRARNMKLLSVFLILAALQPSAIHHHVPEEVQRAVDEVSQNAVSRAVR